MLLPLAALLAAQVGPAANQTEPTETRCAYLVSRDGRVQTLTEPALHVLRDTARDGAYAPGLPAGAAIQCGRSDIVPAANDWKVIDAGHVLFIVDVSGSDDPRVAALEISNGQLRYRFVSGRMTEAEEPRIMARLNAFQLHFQQ